MRRPLFACVLSLAGCASQTPDWIARPQADGGFAATACVKDSGTLALDRQVTVVQARADVARQLESRIAAMDRAHAQRAAPDAEPTPFGTVGKPVAAAALAGLEPGRVEYVELDGARTLCALVSMNREQARQLYDQLVAASGQQPDAAAGEALYRAFASDAAAAQ